MDTPSTLQKQYVFVLTVHGKKHPFTREQVLMAYHLAKMALRVDEQYETQVQLQGIKALYNFFEETDSSYGLHEARELFMWAYNNVQELNHMLFDNGE